MGFNSFALLGLVIAAAGVKIVRDLYRNRALILDDDFTESDRRMTTMAAFYLLLPISVGLHELGHAVAVWTFHGKVVDFGFYFFAGFVSYEAAFSNTQHILVAVAGPFVSVILGVIALGVVFLRRPSLRPPLNELLLQFAILTIANTLIFYPLLDFGLGIEGDFRQMYFGGVPWLSAVILAFHLGILGALYLGSKNAWCTNRLAELTGMPTGSRRGLMGGVQWPEGHPAAGSGPLELDGDESRIQAAAKRVASGWHAPVQGLLQRRPEGSSLTLSWPAGGYACEVAIRRARNGSTTIAGKANAPVAGMASLPSLSTGHWPALPSEDALTIEIRVAMESVERWVEQSSAPMLSAPGQLPASG